MIPAALTHATRAVGIAAFTMATLTLGHTAIAAPIDYTHYIPLADSDGHTTIQPVSHPDPELDEAWKKAQRAAVDLWNESPDINIEITEDSPNTISFAWLPGGAYAYYIPSLSCITGECTYSIYIDSPALEYNKYIVKYRGMYLIAHELGHALGLNDRYNEELDSVMNEYWRYRSKTPTALDVQRVENRIAMYRSLTSG